MANIGINGFGRMGRLGIRVAWGNPVFTFTQVNEIAGNAITSAHLLKFDSIHGIWQNECSADGNMMIVDGQSIAYTSNKAIEDTVVRLRHRAGMQRQIPQNRAIAGVF